MSSNPTPTSKQKLKGLIERYIMKKQKQLGMNPSTASSRLIKDILFKFINDLNLNTCFHCNTAMSRENFSIEHKTPWLDSTTPKQLFFDLDNISFSHLSCNVSHSRKPHKGISNPVCGTPYAYQKGCRCDPCKLAKQKENSKRVR